MKNKPKVRSAAEIKLLYKIYAEGSSLEVTGATIGVTKERIRQLFKQAGFPTRKRTFVDRSPALRAARAKIFSKADLEKLYYDEIKSLSQIAGLYQTSPSQVSKAFADFGIRIRKRGHNYSPSKSRYFPLLTEENLIRLFVTEKRSVRAIADLAGCPRDSVYRWLRKFGIKRSKPKRKT